jgi:BirA family biotin operon repressor/biotin-[acetyl-CoA-carboxylase] ligase
MEYNIIYCDVVDSTNEEIRRLAKNGEEQGLVVVAEKQTAGQGRRRRSWDSPEGTNLYFSILLRPMWSRRMHLC